MARQKVVNGVYIDLTAEEEAEIEARAEAADLDMNHVRGQRDGQLRGSDWTQLGDAALGDHAPEVSEVVWPNDPPTQAAIDAAAE